MNTRSEDAAAVIDAARVGREAFPRRGSLPAHAVELLTLLLLLLYGSDHWYVETPTRILCLVALVWPAARRGPMVWFLLGAFELSAALLNWSDTDNHKYLMSYWCLALAASAAWSAGRDQGEPAGGLPASVEQEVAGIRAEQARWLLGLAMLLAVIWKFLGGQYLDGTFFEHTLLTDSRFSSFLSWFGGPGEGLLQENRELERSLLTADEDGVVMETVKLHSTPATHTLALGLSYWTIFIEGTIAAMFIAPLRTLRWQWMRHAALLVFLFTTYTVATVPGFGWLLAVMGLANCPPALPRTRLAYVIALALIEVYRMPWGDVFYLAR